jgi:hypothetical protein
MGQEKCRKMILGIFSLQFYFSFCIPEATDELGTSVLMTLADHAMGRMMVGIQDEMCRISSAIQS